MNQKRQILPIVSRFYGQNSDFILVSMTELDIYRQSIGLFVNGSQYRKSYRNVLPRSKKKNNPTSIRKTV